MSGEQLSGETGVRTNRTIKWRFDEIVTFLKVVEAGSITAAATHLSLSKSVISKRISDLEHALDVTLLRRSTRHVLPTDRGAILFKEAHMLVRELEETVERASTRDGELQGRLRITAPVTFGTKYVGPVLAIFARNYPKLNLALDLNDKIVDLIDSEYDLAVRIGRPKDSSLVGRRLCLNRRVLCCSPGYAGDKGLPTSIEELAAHQCIDYAEAHASRPWRFQPLKPGVGFCSATTHSRIIANNIEMVREMTLAGLGLAILPLFIVHEQLRQGTLIDALPAAVPLPDTIFAVYPPTRHLSRRVRAAIDHLSAAYKMPPWEAIAYNSVGGKSHSDSRTS